MKVRVLFCREKQIRDSLLALSVAANAQIHILQDLGPTFGLQRSLQVHDRFDRSPSPIGSDSPDPEELLV